MADAHGRDRRHQERLASVGRHVGYLLHQVRSPIVTIGLLARSLRKRAKLTDGERQKVDQIIEQAAKVESMLQDCLDYLRPSAEGAERINVQNLVEWVNAAIQPQAEKANAGVGIDIAKSLPALVGHRQLLREALLNVAHNAVEAAEETTGVVTLSARATEKSVLLAVSDTGNGMAPEVARQALEPFVTTKKKGTGLGLALARKIVEAHHGRITIDSAPGKGTTVTIRLPITMSHGHAPSSRDEVRT